MVILKKILYVYTTDDFHLPVWIYVCNGWLIKEYYISVFRPRLAIPPAITLQKMLKRC